MAAYETTSNYSYNKAGKCDVNMGVALAAGINKRC